MDITPQQAAAIRKLTRRANRRIERAVGGQETYLKSIVRRVTGGSDKFSAATKGLTYEQAALKLEKLDRFLGSMSTTRTGWDWIKKEIVHKAAGTLSGMGYTITDDELAEILIQIDSSNRAEFYRAVNLVQAAKAEAEDWTGSPAQIRQAIEQKATFQQALSRALQARGGIK